MALPYAQHVNNHILLLAVTSALVLATAKMIERTRQERASWRHFAELKAQFGSASAVGERVVFNIAGNKYRLVAWINYDFYTVYVRFVGTHAEYDALDIEDA